MSVTVTYTLTLSNDTKNHAKGVTFSATIARASPASLDTDGMTVSSATIDMSSVTFWSGSNNNPYMDIGSFGRVFINTEVSNQSAISLTESTSAFSLNNLLAVGTGGTSTSVYATKSTSGNVCTYGSNYTSFTITAICQEGYSKSTASVASSVAAGSVSTVTLSNKNLSVLSHKVTWAIGDYSYTETAGDTESMTYTIPIAWVNAIPNAVSATATVTVETLNSSGKSLGSNAYTFTLTVPENIIPSISLNSERIDNSVPSDWDMYIQGRSGIKITATASPGTGASITGYAISGGAAWSQTENVFLVDPITVSGMVTYTVRVTDSRGRSASFPVTISVSEYTAPTISVSTAFRCNAAGEADESGTYAAVKLSGSVAFVDGKNTKALAVSYAESGSTAFSEAITLQDNVSAIIGNGLLDIGHSYQVRFRVTDAFGYTEKVVNVSTAAYTIFFKQGGNAVAFGKIAEHDNAL